MGKHERRASLEANRAGKARMTLFVLGNLYQARHALLATRYIRLR